MSQKDERRPARNAAATKHLSEEVSTTIGSASAAALTEAQTILDRAAARLLTEHQAQAA